MGIPENATFVNEYTLGGPGESIILQEWSDAVPLHHSKYPPRYLYLTPIS